jgi:hypothetical protein
MLEPGGDMPHETSRKSSVYYYIYTLDAFAVCATLLARAGEDLWGHTTPSGASLRGAFAYVAPHAADAFARWPHASSKDHRAHQLERPLLLAAAAGLRPGGMDPAQLVRLARAVRTKWSSHYLISPGDFFATWNASGAVDAV